MSKVFFVNSGSEANDTVVKLVWYYNNALGRPQKKKILSRSKAYHGVTVATASLTGLPNNHRDFDLPIANILHVECPHWYRFAQPGESEEAFATRLAESLEQRILTEGPDEVICGLGRTGNMWGTTTYGMRPDMITCAKALSSGYLPIGAIMISGDIYEALLKQSDKIGVFSHGFTYSGHPVTSAVALETLKLYDEMDILSHVRKVAPRMQAGLRQFQDHPLVGEVRGIGLVGAIELVADKNTKASFDPKLAVGGYLAKRGHHHGIIVRAMGEAIAFCPPLIIKEEEIDLMFERFSQALEDTQAFVGRVLARP
jgi:4-aminobutyrate--pyruvate transaminase